MNKQMCVILFSCFFGASSSCDYSKGVCVCVCVHVCVCVYEACLCARVRVGASVRVARWLAAPTLQQARHLCTLFLQEGAYRTNIEDLRKYSVL